MDGNAILPFSLSEVVRSILDTKAHFKIEEQEVDYYVLHQVQKLIADGIADACGMASEKILTSYEEYGNTSTATVPLTICHNVEQLQRNERLCRRFGMV